MKACLLQTPSTIEDRPLEFTEVDLPVPSNNELLIKVTACGVCRTDLHVVEGDLEQRLSPVIPGHQIVGLVEKFGDAVSGISSGQRIGVAWLHSTCGNCRFCSSERENLCEKAEFTGWTCNGGFAEHVIADSGFVYPVPDGFEDIQAAPLLCAGIIGFRALKLTGLRSWKGARLGIYDFGAAGHVCIQVARSRGLEVYVATRDREKPQALAEELGQFGLATRFPSRRCNSMLRSSLHLSVRSPLWL